MAKHEIKSCVTEAAEAASLTMLEGVDTSRLPILTWDIGGQSEVTLDMSLMSVAMLGRMLLAGAQHRIGDAGALPAWLKALKRASTLEDKRAAMQKLCDHYESGTEAWDVKRSGFMRSDDILVNLADALTGKHVGGDESKEVYTFESAKAALSKKSPAERDKIWAGGASGWLAQAVQEHKEKLLAATDVDSLSGGL